MTNEQFYFAIGVPLIFNGLVMVLVFIWFNSRLTSLEARMTSLENRVENRITSLENRLENRISSLEGKIDLLVGSLH